MADYATAARAITAAESLGLVSHLNPDPDTIGSAAALALAAQRAGKRVAAYCRDAVPANYRFIPGSGVFSTDPAVLAGVDVLVVVDCSEPGRIGPDGEAILSAAALVIDIDHHTDGVVFGEVRLVEPGAAASGVLIHELLNELGWSVDREIAEALYTAIETDTGSFHYPNTTPRCLRVTAELLERGCRPQKVAQALYESHRPERFRLLGLALNTLELALEGRLALIQVTRAMYDRSGASVEDTEDIVDYARGLAGVEVGAFLREEADGTVKLSLRSKGAVRVDELARRIGGGGHPCAAGAGFSGSLGEAREWVIANVAQALSEPAGADC